MTTPWKATMAPGPTRFTRGGLACALVVVCLFAWIGGAAAQEGGPRGYLGMRIQPVTFNDMQRLGLSSASGVMVELVLPGGPAETAGVKDGDIIQRYAGAKIQGFSQMLLMAQVAEPGEEVPLTIWRDGAEREMTLTVAEPPALADTVDIKKEFPAFGLTVSPVTPSLIQRAGIQAGAQGVVVVGVAGPAAGTQVRELDLITAVGTRRVTSLDTFGEALAKARAEADGLAVPFRISRKRERIVAAIQPED